MTHALIISGGISLLIIAATCVDWWAIHTDRRWRADAAKVRSYMRYRGWCDCPSLVDGTGLSIHRVVAAVQWLECQGEIVRSRKTGEWVRYRTIKVAA